MLGANATTRTPKHPPTNPMIIQGRRMPSCEAVRSLSLPKNGLLTMANSEPMPVTSPRLFGACSIPTSELTFNAKVTSKGARNSRLVPICAIAYSVIKLHPTRVPSRGPETSGNTSSSRRVWARRCGRIYGLLDRDDWRLPQPRRPALMAGRRTHDACAAHEALARQPDTPVGPGNPHLGT
jgi:hypothetical protein